MSILSLAAATALVTPAAMITPVSGVTVFDAGAFAGAQLSTALDMVQRLPGFTLDTGDGVRGFGGAAGNVLIDGQRTTSKADNLHDALQRIPASSVARIELIRGGAPGIDMQGRTVLANIVLKSAPRTNLNLVAVGRLVGDGKGLASGRVELEHRDGELAMTFGLVIYQYPPDDPGKGLATQWTAPGGTLLNRQRVKVEANDTGLNLRSSIQAPWRGGIGHINFAFDYDTFRENEDDGVTDYTKGGAFRTDAANQQDRSRKGELGADYAFSLGHHVLAKIVALQTLGTDGFGARNVLDGSVGKYRQLTRTGESIGRVELNWKPLANFNLEGGGEVAYNFLDSGAVYSQDGVAVALPSANIRVDEMRYEAFAVGSWRVLPTLQMEAGGRIETSTISQSGDSTNSATFTYPKPRIALTWTPNAVDQLRATYERVVGQLVFTDFATSANLVGGQVNAGNANLEPQREWRIEGTYERKILGTGSIVATLRHADIEQVLDVIPVQGVDAPGNIGNGTRDTAILSLTLPLARIGMPGAQFKADGTWISSRVSDPTTHERRPISGDHPFNVFMTLTNDVPSLKSSWEIDYLTGAHNPSWRIEEVRKVIYEPDLDLIWIYRPRPGQTVHLQVSNVTSRQRLRTRTDWTGPRDASPIAFYEQYAVKWAPVFMVRFRQAV